MKKIFGLIGIVGAFIAGCFLNEKYGWGIGKKIAGKVQSAADFVADRLEKTRGSETTDTNTTGETAGSESAS